MGQEVKVFFSRAIYGGVNWIYLTFVWEEKGKDEDYWISDRWEDDGQMMATPPVIPRFFNLPS